MIMLFLFSGVITATFQLDNTNIIYLNNHETYLDKTITHAGFYESNNEQINFLLTPEIESDVIHFQQIKLFIPIYRNESKLQQKVCGTYEKEDNLSEIERKEASRAHLLDCYNQYNLVFVNGKRIKVDYLIYAHPRTGQHGIICYVPLDDPNEGMNTLEIKKTYHEQSSTEWSIPFYFVPRKTIWIIRVCRCSGRRVSHIWKACKKEFEVQADIETREPEVDQFD